MSRMVSPHLAFSFDFSSSLLPRGESFKCYASGLFIVSLMPSRLRGSLNRHWKLLGLIAVVIIASASTVYAYWKTTTPSTPTLHVTASYPPLELRMQLDKLEFQQGETVNVHLYLKNIGSETITVSFNDMNDQVGFVVKDRSNNEISMHPEVFLPLTWEVELPPGDEIRGDDLFHGTYRPMWDQKSNMPSNDYYLLQVPAGKYQIIGRTGTVHIEGKPDFQPGRIETTAITITIT